MLADKKNSCSCRNKNIIVRSPSRAQSPPPTGMDLDLGRFDVTGAGTGYDNGRNRTILNLRNSHRSLATPTNEGNESIL